MDYDKEELLEMLMNGEDIGSYFDGCITELL